MKRNFVFKWYKNVKYGTPITRVNCILVSKGTGDIGRDAKLATDLFCKSFGNLKKNTIVSIQELDEAGKPVGEPIIPAEKNSIIPEKK